MDKRLLMFIGFSLAALALVFEPLRELMNSAARGEYYSHTVLIPLVTGYLFYQERKEIFGTPGPSYVLGGTFVVIGLAFHLLGAGQGIRLSENDLVALRVFSSLMFFIGGFILTSGRGLCSTFRE